MSSLGRQLALYISAPQPCDYLPGQLTQNIFISPDVKMTAGIYEHLINVGFRRSGQHTYRPHCSACRACISCRLDVQQFKTSRSQKRLLSKNKHLSFKPVNATFSDEYFELYLRYQAFKHPDGPMKNFEAKDYNAFLHESFGNSLIYETRLDDRLIAVSVTDVFSDALSAVYTFFDPEFSVRSLGTYSVLQQIKAAQESQKQYLYLGYYVQDSVKMSYKTNFRPIEMLINDEWTTYKKADLLPSQSSSVDSPLSF